MGQGNISQACVKNSVHGGGGGGACSYGGVVSQHALQVSRPTAKGEVEGDLAGGGGSSGPHQRDIEGDLARGGVETPP